VATCAAAAGCTGAHARASRINMDIVYLLIPLSLVLVFLIGAVFWWAVRRGQFDDLEGPAYRILMDDEITAKK
jgi:cbb3-type cytochrome oxidase maturation protein